VVADVLEEDPFGVDFPDDAGNVGPEMAWILHPAFKACLAERLAGISGSDDIHLAAPRSAVKRFNVAPNRSRIEGAVLKTRNQLFDCRNFDFHVTDGSSLWASDSKPEVDSADSSAERQEPEGGTYSHKRLCFLCRRFRRYRIDRRAAGEYELPAGTVGEAAAAPVNHEQQVAGLRVGLPHDSDQEFLFGHAGREVRAKGARA
jgi:hypothetical protein